MLRSITLLLIIWVTPIVAHSQQVQFLSWSIHPDDLTSGKFDLQAGQTTSFSFDVEISRNFDHTAQEYPPVLFKCQLAKLTNGNSGEFVPLSSVFTITTDDFDEGVADKTFSAVILAIGGGGDDASLLRNNDEILLTFEGG